MTSAPVLRLPNLQLPFVIEADACDHGIGGVLMQEGRPIAFMSKADGVKNRSLSTYEKFGYSGFCTEVETALKRGSDSSVGGEVRCF